VPRRPPLGQGHRPGIPPQADQLRRRKAGEDPRGPEGRVRQATLVPGLGPPVRRRRHPRRPALLRGPRQDPPAGPRLPPLATQALTVTTYAVAERRDRVASAAHVTAISALAGSNAGCRCGPPSAVQTRAAFETRVAAVESAAANTRPVP